MAEEKAENHETYRLENEDLYSLCAYSSEISCPANPAPLAAQLTGHSEQSSRKNEAVFFRIPNPLSEEKDWAVSTGWPEATLKGLLKLSLSLLITSTPFSELSRAPALCISFRTSSPPASSLLSLSLSHESESILVVKMQMAESRACTTTWCQEDSKTRARITIANQKVLATRH